MILPLKLEWEPFYSLPEDVCALQVGDRVLAPFAGHSYLGVVSAVDATPPYDMVRRVRPIYGPDPRKPHIFPSEIAFWRLVADYYMCSVGEVYKAAYPSVKDEVVSARSKEREFVPMSSSLPFEVQDVRPGGAKTLVVSSPRSFEQLAGYAFEEASAGGSVLWLVPQMTLSKQLHERLEGIFGSRLMLWGSDMTPARKREVARRVRGGEPYVVLGTRSALFLPHTKLSLVIVQGEHEPSYKQTSPAPRYNARDAAVLLAGVHSSKVVLESPTPSFETLMNVACGKFDSLFQNGFHTPAVEIIDTRAEMRKRGMVGDVPRRLMAMLPAEAARGGRVVALKPRRAAFPKLEDLSSQLSSLMPDAVLMDDQPDCVLPEDTSLLAIFGIDAMLGKQDFRADERAVQIIKNAFCRCPGLGKVVLVCRRGTHPVFDAVSSGNVDAMLSERRDFCLPPFSRIVDVLVHDSLPSRLFAMKGALASKIAAAFSVSLLPSDKTDLVRVIPLEDGIRVILPRDRLLSGRKTLLRDTVASFEKECKYPSHIFFDVDPL